MKDIRPALRALLLSDATVSSLVGGTRIFPVRLPQGQRLASVVYNRITENVPVDMAGFSGFGYTQMQIDAWTDNADGATQLGDACLDVLVGFKGPISYGSASPQNSVTVGGILFVTGRDDYDSEAQMYRVSRDYNIWFDQTT